MCAFFSSSGWVFGLVLVRSSTLALSLPVSPSLVKGKPPSADRIEPAGWEISSSGAFICHTHIKTLRCRLKSTNEKQKNASQNTAQVSKTKSSANLSATCCRSAISDLRTGFSRPFFSPPPLRSEFSLPRDGTLTVRGRLIVN